MMNRELFHLSLIAGVGPVTIERLIKGVKLCGQPLNVLYNWSAAEFQQLGFSVEQTQRLMAGLQDTSLVEKEYELAVKHRVSIITLENQEYPTWLKEIYAPPPVLYVRGSIQQDTLTAPRHIAVVGSRHANSYARGAIDLLLPELIRAGWCTVSGGARGVDAYTHQVTLREGGATIAVLGSGLLNMYPREHDSLFEAIVEKGGLLMSPFPLKRIALPGNFPARNRIIAGIARACIVVQAAEKSGALITAAHALQEGRELGAVPGSIFDPLSAGCHALIRQGALAITNTADLMMLLGQDALGTQQGGAMVGTTATKTDPLPAECIENKVIQLCKEPAVFDEILLKTGLACDELHQQLWDLQLAGVLRQTAWGAWQVTSSIITRSLP